MNNKILIIDDDELVCQSLKKILIKFGYHAEFITNAEFAIEKIQEYDPDIVILDIYLTSANGLDVLKEIHSKFMNLPVVMITAYADVNIAVKALKLGATDFLLKPLDLDQLKIIIDRVITSKNLKSEVEKLQQIIKEDYISKEFFGKSSKIQKVVNAVEKLAKSYDTTILIEGESGTGKEMIAKFIHQHSPRKDGPFIRINCSAIPRELAESELFGHEKGAFTGAVQKTKMGKFELASGGTILLDEIAELSPEMQAKLLRVLQEKKFYRLGGEKEIEVDVRVLAATNKKLDDEVKKGNFREDLFYRLNVGYVYIPPLRERKEDILFLAYSFLNEFGKKFEKKFKGFEPAALELLQEYPWKGNIRELKNVIERVTILLDDDEVKEKHLQFLKPAINEHNLSDDKFILKIPPKGVSIDIVLRKLIEDTLKITNGNQVRAAKILGLTRSKLRYRMEQLGIEVTKNIQNN
ncbi:MAG: sigma-54 dependent transcriptional regulator [Ignavibacterium sp.]|nr:sigma-54 dependent transcriptional regulator [Ignavibacterium sp.]MCX7610796.1 sigma-54 dependent transcriptional regulator [Ignavibacterium sp.]MDW8375700.1 sigma-54 dependent transcriptional regulator [Ignavibacteriales bacterium]